MLLRLERSHGTLTWSRTPWNGNVSNGDLSLFSNPDIEVTTGLKIKYGLGSGNSPPVGGVSGMGGIGATEVCGGSIEEGFLDVSSLKEVALHCRESELITIARRYGERACRNDKLPSVHYPLTHFDFCAVLKTQRFPRRPRPLGAYLSSTAAT